MRLHSVGSGQYPVLPVQEVALPQDDPSRQRPHAGQPHEYFDAVPANSEAVREADEARRFHRPVQADAHVQGQLG